MAGQRDPDDLDALLAEVERSLSPGGQAPLARRADAAARPAPAAGTGGLARARAEISRGVLVSAVLAAVVGVGFFLLPFVGVYGATTAAAGAFLAALVAGWLARWR